MSCGILSSSGLGFGDQKFLILGYPPKLCPKLSKFGTLLMTATLVLHCNLSVAVAVWTQCNRIVGGILPRATVLLLCNLITACSLLATVFFWTLSFWQGHFASIFSWGKMPCEKNGALLHCHYGRPAILAGAKCLLS
jgi:hypothetical protein